MRENQQSVAVGRQAMERRLAIVAAIGLLWGLAVFARLAYLQLFRHGDYLARAQRQQQRTIEITPKRGAIYDRNMRPLAMSLEVDSAFAIPSELGENKALAAKLLSGVLGIPRDVLEAKFTAAGTFVWVSRKLPPGKAEAVAALNLKGIYLQKENQRFYPKRDLAAHVLGYVDIDEKGQAGIERELEGMVRGQSEKIVVMADARQRWFDGRAAKMERGASVVLTLDEKVQYIAERELASAIAKTQAMAGSVVVLDPNNGEILAMANWPKFNPNAAGDASGEMRMNRAVSIAYEPGSTFKLITLAAAFDQGITRPDEVFDCENGAVYVAGHRIRDHKPFGLLSVSEILAKSSDVGAIKIALRLGAPKFYEYIRAFGFGTHTGVDLPSESRGILQHVENWRPLSIGSISMGQEVGVTPIQLASAVSAIASGGLLHRPHVVRELRRGEQPLPMPAELAPAEPKRVIRPETAATLRRLMEGVILSGTGTLARLDGWTAAGKTGSAQKIDLDTGRYSPTQLIASFTGFAPINNPALTVLVSLDSPVGLHEGGQVAAPVFKRIAEQVLSYLNVARDVPLQPGLLNASYRQSHARDSVSLEDFTPVDFSGQPDAPPAESNQEVATEQTAAAPEMSMGLDEANDVSVPDFTGKTMREVTAMCLHLGMEPVLLGSGVAANQTPLPGTKAKGGARVTVQFGTPSFHTATSVKRSGLR